jgi:hypothetical protein
MRDIPGIVFSSIVNAFVVALFVSLLGACAATPSKYSLLRDYCADTGLVIREQGPPREPRCERIALGRG